MALQTSLNGQGPRDSPVITFASCCTESHPRLSLQWHKSLLSMLGLLFGLDPPPQALLGERSIVTICHQGWFVVRWPLPEAALSPAAQVGLLIPGGQHSCPQQNSPPTCHARHAWPVPLLPGGVTRSVPGGAGPFGIVTRELAACPVLRDGHGVSLCPLFGDRAGRATASPPAPPGVVVPMGSACCCHNLALRACFLGGETRC